MNMETIQIESINCRGLRDRNKRLDILEKAKEEKVNILCLQETHLIDTDINQLKQDWNIDYFISGTETNSGGVLIAIDKNFEYTIHDKINSDDGRYIILDIEIIDIARVLIINLYAPNEDSPLFFEKLFQIIENRDIKNIIMTGDWNLVNNFNEDTLNYKKHNNPKASAIVNNYKDKLDLLDIWRHNNPQLRQYTWRQMFHKKMARLDFFLISETLLDIYGGSKIKSSYRSDHAPINLKLIISKHKRGKGNWKLNNSLLSDTVLKNKIEEEIELVVCTYACTPYNQEYIKHNFRETEIEFLIDIELLWEVLHAQVRYVVMAYAANKKRKQNIRESQLTKEIEKMENHLAQKIENEIWIQDLENKKTELENIRNHKLQGSLIRSRWQFQSLGEKPTIFFLNLENKNYISKHIRELKKDNTSIHNPEDILEEMRNFYENLFKKKKNVEIGKTPFKNISKNLTKLDNNDKIIMEKEITLEELQNIIIKSKNNKSPGPDGFTNEYYKILWPTIKIILLKLLNAYRNKNLLNPSQLEGTITCIPKGDKIRNNLKNWRPITLLNAIYKFNSGILAHRIKNVLPKLINPDQKGFINGRFLGENTRLIYDIIEECNNQNSKALLILIDFEKAFDSISWEFIAKILALFNFGENTINWVKSLQIGSTSKILQNGNFSKNITLERGCRQGDPVSPYLFVLAAELLAEAVRSNKEIQGIKLYNQEHKISLYADDTTLLLKPNEMNIRNCMQTLFEFEQVSGLRVNKEKTKVAKLGVWGDNRNILCQDLKLDWTQKFTLLGINYNIDNINNITDNNIDQKIGEIKKLICLWNTRNLTPYGKITIVKSLFISKITHILLSLPSPTFDTFNKLEELFKKIIWQGKGPKFRTEIMETQTSLGGMKMTNLRVFDASLKLSWLKRLNNQTKGWSEFPIHYRILDTLKYGDLFPKQVLDNIKNKFWKDMVRCIINLNKTLKFTKWIQIQNMPLWYNSALNIEYRKNWENKGYHILNDVLDNNGNLFTLEKMNENGINMNFLDYHKLNLSVKKLRNEEEIYTKLSGPYLPRIMFEIGTYGKGCSKTYNRLMSYNGNIIKEVKKYRV